MIGDLVILSLLFSALMASGNPLEKRAGAPTPLPIPSNCTVIDSDDCTGSSCSPSKNFRAIEATVQENQLYAYYLDMDDPQVLNSTFDQLFQQCLETCYGYGLPGDCKSVWTSSSVPAISTVPDEAWGCELYSKYLGPVDFQIINDTSIYVDSRVGNIICAVTASNATLRR